MATDDSVDDNNQMLLTPTSFIHDDSECSTDSRINDPDHMVGGNYFGKTSAEWSSLCAVDNPLSAYLYYYIHVSDLVYTQC